jgi:hypothetical protein
VVAATPIGESDDTSENAEPNTRARGSASTGRRSAGSIARGASPACANVPTLAHRWRTGTRRRPRRRSARPWTNRDLRAHDRPAVFRRTGADVERKSRSREVEKSGSRKVEKQSRR